MMHKFNDHNTCSLDAKEQLKQNLGALAVNKVYRASLSIASIRFKLGHYEAALEAIEEAIRIA